MKEGWLNNEYLILFEEQSASLEKAYGFPELLPGFGLIGIRSWDDFLVQDERQDLFTVPTLPLMREHLAAYEFKQPLENLVPDERISGKIKWYVTPLVFGGEPTAEENTSWITLAQHAELVQWWNRKYRELSKKSR
jgi:hypothetical protein